MKYVWYLRQVNKEDGYTWKKTGHVLIIVESSGKERVVYFTVLSAFACLKISMTELRRLNL